MSAPAFAVTRRRQKSLHELLVRVRAAIGNELQDFIRRRRQADEIETEPSNQRHTVGLR